MGSLSAQTIPQHPNHTNAQGHRQGTWTILYNKDWKVVQDTTQAQFYRVISYTNDLPVGKVRDYYRSGKLQWEGRLLRDRPKEMMEGKCVWYYESGKVEQISLFEKGKAITLEEISVNFEKGKKYYELGQYHKALIIFEKYYYHFTDLLNNYPEPLYKYIFWLKNCYKYTKGEVKVNHLDSLLNKLKGRLGDNNKTVLSLKGREAFRNGNYRESIFFFEKLKARQENKQDSIDYLNVCNDLVIAYNMDGQYQKAEKLLFKIGKIKELKNDRHKKAEFYHGLGLTFLNQGKYVKAKAFLKKAKKIMLLIDKEKVKYSRVCYNLAQVYGKLGLYKKSELLHKDAINNRLKLFGKNDIEYANYCEGLAGIYSTLGLYEKAKYLYLESNSTYYNILGENHVEYAYSCSNLAELYRKIGLFEKAQKFHINALNTKIKVLGEDHPSYGLSCNNLGLIYQERGYYKQAESYLTKAKDIFEKKLGKNHPNYLKSCSNLAEVYRVQRKYSSAELLCKEAKDIEVKVLGKTHPSYAGSCNNLALLYSSQGMYAQAEHLYKEAKDIFLKVLGKMHPAYATSCNNLASFYMSQKKYPKAFTLWQEAFTNLQNQLKQNLAYTSEKNRQQFLQANIDRHFEGFHSFAQDYIDSLTIPQSKKVLIQWYNNQLLTKSLLFQSTQKTKERIYASGDTALIRQFEGFVARRVQRDKVLEWTIKQRKQNGINLDSLNGQINALEQALARKSVEFAQELEEYKWHNWQEVQQQLKLGEVAIEIIRYKRWHKKWTDTTHYAAFIVTPNSPYPTPVFLKNGNELEGKAFRYYQRRNIHKKTRGLDQHSYAHFWQPIQAQLQQLYPNAKRVFASLDGVYHQINLETLWHPEQKKYLGELLDIRLVSSTKDLLKRGKSQPVAKGKKVQLFGFPTYASAKQTTQKKKEIESFFDTPSATTKKKLRDLHQGHITPLPGTKKEVEWIGQLLQQQGIAHQVHLAQQASEARVKALKNPRILHLATHGYFLQDETLYKGYRRQGLQWHWGGTDIKQYVENPLLRCGLLWAGAEATIKNEKRPQGGAASKFAEENGLLTAQEALNLNLDSTQLVVLSACETGKGKIQNGEGVYGLQRAFLSAGAKNVLMSLWKVDDMATQWFMQYFYESWAKSQLSSPDGSGDVRKAYRYAQQKLRQDYPSSYYWGAFVLVSQN